MTPAAARTTPVTPLYRKRRVANSVLLASSLGATMIGLFWLAWILFTLLVNGLDAIGPSLFLQTTPSPGSDGGLANAIVGSVIMTAVGVAIGAPVGLLAGTFLAEYGRYSRISPIVRFINDVLLSAPSIIVGLFVYQIMVVPMRHFSGIAGGVALAIIVIPVVVRTTEDMLNLVPNSLRE